MLTIESKTKKINQPDEKIFHFLCDFNKLKGAFGEKAESWESTTDSCKFKIENYPAISLKIAEKIPCSLVKYSEDGLGMFNFSLEVHLKTIAEYETELQIIINADISGMMKTMAEKPLLMFADGMADFLCAYHYNY